MFKIINIHRDFSKQDKLILRRGAKNFRLDPKLESPFGTTLKRLIIKEDEKARVFGECYSSNFTGHAGRDNTIKKN